MAIASTIISFLVLFVGFYAAYKLESGMLLLFIILEVIAALFNILTLVLIVVNYVQVAALLNIAEKNSATQDIVNLKVREHALVIIMAVSFILIVPSIVLQVLTVVWARTVRSLAGVTGRY